jgi:hypothetical protein
MAMTIKTAQRWLQDYNSEIPEGADLRPASPLPSETQENGGGVIVLGFLRVRNKPVS